MGHGDDCSELTPDEEAAVAKRFALLAVLLGVLGCTRPASSPASLTACPPHTFVIAGACLDEDDARAYCGSGAQPEVGGCAPATCSTGEPVDLASGECVPRLGLRKMAAAHKLDLKADGPLACAKEGAAMSVEGTSFACLPRAASCGRGSRWSESTCHPDPACPLGSVPDAKGACVAVLRRGPRESTLDVGAWIRLVVGPDGGDGTNTICGPLVQRPWLASVVAHGKATLDVQVSFVFPDNDVAQARVTVKARRRFDPHSDDPLTPVVLATHLDPVWKALRAIGGVANAASATTAVHCNLEGGSDSTGIPQPAKAPREAPESEKPAS
jgi:hypothetical protein